MMKIRFQVSMALVVLLAAAPFGAAHAQEKCSNGQSVGCDWDPTYGWVKRGSVPSSSSSSGAHSSSAPVDRAALEESMRRYQEEKRQKQAQAEPAPSVPGAGTCKLDPLPPPSEPFTPEMQRAMLRSFSERCVEERNSDACYSAAMEHSFDTIPEARPNQAYRFMKLACQYGDSLSCEDIKVRCTPE
jgi:hypothetical protein